MTKLESIEHKIFASEAPLDEIGQFGSALDTTKLNTKDVTTIQALPAYTKGWGSAVISDSNYPTMEEMNGVLNVMSYHTGYLYQEGMPAWRSDREYSATSIVKEPTGTKFFRSLKDGNIGNAIYDTEWWEELKLGGSGLELCDIGMALYVDETKGLRRYLNGQIVDINTNTQAFLNRLLQIQTTNPDYFTTEENWQAEALLNIDGCVYKFVLNYADDGETVISVRLPKYPDYVEVSAGSSITTAPVTGFVKSTTTSGIVLLPRATLNPNWDGSYALTSNGKYGHFDMFAQDGSGNVSVRNTGKNSVYYVDAQADLSNLKLKNTKLKLRYFIQIATGSETENNIINEIELNNPYSLLDVKWSDKLLNNISWLRSEGQANSKAIYNDVYELILREYNSGTDETETVGGVSITFRRGVETNIKITTDKSAYDSILSATGTAWYYVLDIASEMFYLPQSDGFLQFGGSGNFIEAGLPNITGKLGGDSANGVYGLPNLTGAFKNIVMTYNNIGLPNGGACISSFEFDASRSNPIYGKSDTVQPNAVKGYLYFYVGETVQNANLIDAGRIGEQLATKTDMLQASGASMPSSKYIDLTLGESGSTYTAPANGWFGFAKKASANGQYVYFGEMSIPYGLSGGDSMILLPCKKGRTKTLTYNLGGTTSFFRFYYAVGSESEVQ